MSIYVMTVGELAKKRGEPVGEFVKKVQGLGFDAGSHAKRLTQPDLDSLIGLLDGTARSNANTETKETPAVKLENPNVLLVSLANGKYKVLLVDANVSDTDEVSLKVVTSTTEDSVGEALLEFRKQLGMKMGIN